MHTDHTLLQIIGHVALASLFLYRGLAAIPRFAHHRNRLASRGVPYPALVLGMGLAFMLVGGVLVATGIEARAGAVLLIVFTAAANLAYHDFWSVSDPRERARHRNTFCNNVAVMGGLVLVMA